jgi:osmotically-inducible protein OsmY
MTENITTDLKRRAQKAILNDTRTREYGIEVLDDNGIVTLKGLVPSHHVKTAAESIVNKVFGIASVINELHVEVEELDNSLKEKVSSE